MYKMDPWAPTSTFRTEPWQDAHPDPVGIYVDAFNMGCLSANPIKWASADIRYRSICGRGTYHLCASCRDVRAGVTEWYARVSKIKNAKSTIPLSFRRRPRGRPARDYYDPDSEGDDEIYGFGCGEEFSDDIERRERNAKMVQLATEARMKRPRYFSDEA